MVEVRTRAKSGPYNFSNCRLTLSSRSLRCDSRILLKYVTRYPNTASSAVTNNVIAVFVSMSYFPIRLCLIEHVQLPKATKTLMNTMEALECRNAKVIACGTPHETRC